MGTALDAEPPRAFAVDDVRALVAEFVGTFIFVTLGAGSAITANSVVGAKGGLALLLIAIGNGLGLALAISIVGHISGGHLNPAVTISMWVTQRIGSVLALAYMVAQILGATLAAVALKYMFASSLWGPVHLGAPALSSSNNIGFGLGVFIEALMTFFLVMAVFGTAVDDRHPQIAGFGIGLVVMLDVILGGPLTGAAMNPARAFGPFIAGNYWTSNWAVYWIGPVIGAIIAALIYGYILIGDESELEPEMSPNSPPSSGVPWPDPVTNAAVTAEHQSEESKG